jgi:hypothetical protein
MTWFNGGEHGRAEYPHLFDPHNRQDYSHRAPHVPLFALFALLDDDGLLQRPTGGRQVFQLHVAKGYLGWYTAVPRDFP